MSTGTSAAGTSTGGGQQPLLINKWHLRKVAASASKACWICYKSTSSVLITPDNKDFFYICNGHLKDRAFCTPDGAELSAAKLKREQDELARENAKVIAEFEERRKERARKRAKDKKDDGEKDKDREKDKKKQDEDDKDDKDDEESKAKKLKELEEKAASGDGEGGGDGKTDADEVRVFELARSFYKQRIDRIRNAQQMKRDRERLKNPSTFPSVPTGPPGS